MPQSKELPWSITIKWISGSTTIKRTATFKMIAREYHNQKKSEGVPKLKRIPGSITIKMTAREYSKIVLSVIIIIKNDCNGAFQLTKLIKAVETNTTREYHNQTDCSGVLQTIVLTGSVKNKRTARA